MLREWLVNRGVDPAMFWKAMQQTGVQFDKTKNLIRYPRYSRATGEIIGWKVRSLANKKQWNDPGGIGHGEVYPFMWADPEQDAASELWICEGESDMLAVVCQQPLPRHVDLMAVPGANAFAPEWVSIIQEYGRVVLFPDNDEAGELLTQAVCALVPTVRRARLPKSVNDVTEFLAEVGTIEDMVDLAAAAVAVPVERKLRRFGWTWTGKEASEFNTLLASVITRDVQLRRKGSEFVGLCPFHDEKTPSFHVNVEKGLWRCQGCNKAGDVVSYVQQKHGLSYPQANQWLKEFA